MDEYGKIFQLLKKLIEKNIWDKLDDGKVLGIELPDTKDLYYASIVSSVTLDSGIMFFEGQKGLENLKSIYRKEPTPYDLVPQMHFLGIFFEEDYDFLTPIDIKVLKENPYGDFDGLGYPRLFRKNRGMIEGPLTYKDLEVMRVILEQLVEDSLENIQSIQPFNEETRITFRKIKDSKWKRAIEKPSFTYNQIQVNEMVIFPLKKNTEKIFENWHLGCLYHIDPVYADEGDEEKIIYPRGIFILSSEESLLNHTIYEEEENTDIEVRELIEETIRDLSFRPVKIITDDEVLYYVFKDYLKALDIEMIYDPNDEVLFDFKSFNYDDPYNIGDEGDLELEDLFHTYLESKGIIIDGLNAIDQDTLDELMIEFEEVIENLAEGLEKDISEGRFNKETSLEDIKAFFKDAINKSKNPEDK